MDSSIIMVGKEPFCIWEVDLLEKNREFIKGIDCEYFDYVIDRQMDSEDRQRAALSLKLALHHATETMFSLLGAYVQAPDCAYAWISKCSNHQLRDFLRSIGGSRAQTFTKLNIDSVTWVEIAKSVLHGYLPNTKKSAKTAELYAKFWSRLKSEYLEQSNIDEYNSIKHGLRVRTGGYSLSVGVEHEYGITPPAEEMKVVGHSEFGSTYLKVVPIGEGRSNRSFTSKQHSQNWRIEKISLLLQLVSMSITNITSALKLANGISGKDCKYRRPEKDSDFDLPWSYSCGMNNLSMNLVIPESEIFPTTKEELLKKVLETEEKYKNQGENKDE